MTPLWTRFAVFAVSCLLAATGSVATADAQSRVPVLGRGVARGCDDAARDASLRADQAQLLARLGHLSTLRGPADLSELADLGWSVPAHYYASFENLGVGITRPGTLTDREVRSGDPAMVVYRPVNPQRADPGAPFAMNFPYELIGWAHGLPYTPGVYPPSSGLCFRDSDWFVHEQGLHTIPNWGFVPQPPPERYRGENPGTLALAPAPGGVTHGRFWDIHLWLNPHSDVPAIAMEDPFGRIPGMPMAPGAFFYPANRS